MTRISLLAFLFFLLLTTGGLVMYLVEPSAFRKFSDYNKEGKNIVQGGSTRPVVSIRSKEFYVEVADTMARQAQGLSGREGLGENEGMYFIFVTAGSHSFWMKDMQFPIDLLWILDDKVVGVVENMQPEPEKSIFTYTRYYSPEPVNRVLEAQAGTIQKYGFKAGDPVEFFPVKSP